MTHKDTRRITETATWRRSRRGGLFRMQIICGVCLLFVLLVGMESVAIAQAGEQQNHAHNHATVVESGQTPPANIFCPVMPDMKVNPQMYSDYKGKRVYFCCATCRAAFEREPEKYLALLPQFGGSIASADHDQHNGGYGFSLIRLVKPMGITTLSLLVLTFLAGVFRRKAPKLLFKWHKRLGVTTVVFAIVHAVLVIVSH